MFVSSRWHHLYTKYYDIICTINLTKYRNNHIKYISDYPDSTDDDGDRRSGRIADDPTTTRCKYKAIEQTWNIRSEQWISVSSLRSFIRIVIIVIVLLVIIIAR